MSSSTTPLPTYPAPPVTRTRIAASAGGAPARVTVSLKSAVQRCKTRLLREQPPAGGEADQIHRRVRVQLAQDAPAVRLDGARADVELTGDLRGGIPLDAELEDLALPRGERRQGRASPFRAIPQPAVVRDHDPGHLRREVGLATRHGADGVHHFRSRLRLAGVPKDARLQGVRNVRFVGDHAQGQHAPVGVVAQQLACDADPADARQHHVEHDHLGLGGADGGDGLLSIGSLCYDLKVFGAGKHRTKAFAEKQMIVYERYAKGCHEPSLHPSRKKRYCVAARIYWPQDAGCRLQIRPLGPCPDLGKAAYLGAATRGLSIGNLSTNWVPRRGRFTARMLPPSRSMVPAASQRPRPVPRDPFVLKYGSKSRPRTSEEIPSPSSATVTTTVFLSWRAAMVTVPPFGIASRPLRSRLTNSSDSSDAEPRTAGRSAIDIRMFTGTAEFWKSTSTSAAACATMRSSRTALRASVPVRAKSCKRAIASEAISIRWATAFRAWARFWSGSESWRNAVSSKLAPRSVLPRSWAMEAASSPNTRNRSRCRTASRLRTSS